MVNIAQHCEDRSNRADNWIWEQTDTVKKEFKLEGTNISEKKTAQEIYNGSINSFYDVISLPVELYLLKRSKRTYAHTHC